MPDWSGPITTAIAQLEVETAREAEIVEELSQHMTDRYEELLVRGESEESARRSVLEELQDGTLAADLSPVVKRRSERDAVPAPPSGRGSVGDLGRDLRHGLRLLRLDPGFASIALLSLALGIGANTAIFQLLDAVRLRSLPVSEPERLARIRIVDNTHGRSGGFTSEHPEVTTAIWDRIRRDQRGFSSVAAWSLERLNTAHGGEARNVDAMWVSGSFFDLLGVRARIGRLISSAEDRPDCASPGVVISDAYWQRELGGRPSVVGSRISLEGHPFEIIGVTPPGFFGVEVGRHFDVAIPLCAEATVLPEEPRSRDPRQWWLAVVGRLKPGATLKSASAQLAVISPQVFQAAVPTKYNATERGQFLKFKLGALPAASGWSSLRQDYASPLWLLLAISGLVLLIACGNLANLMVARANARQREIAIRLALGASRARLIRQFLCETLVLASLGAACGAALAQALTRVLVSYLSREDARVFVDLKPDWRVFAFTTGLALATCLLFGLAPALAATRTDPNEALKAGARGIAGSRVRFGARRVLVVSQVSLSLVLLVGALLFVGTFRNLIGLDAGFRQDHILIVDIDVTPLSIPAPARSAFKRDLLDRLRAIPGVASAASARLVPASGNAWNDDIAIEGSRAEPRVANINLIGPGYFRTLGTPFLAGRDFDDRDSLASPAVAIVTETFVKRFLPGGSPIGKTFVQKRAGAVDRRFEIVGLVRDTKYTDLREEFTPIAFLAGSQDDEPSPYTHAVIRSDEPLPQIVSSVKHVVGGMSPAIVLNFRSFSGMIRESLLRERLMATLSGFFGVLAAVLAMVGLYGVISFMVVRRRNEIGIRMALGASRGAVVSMVLREAAALLGIGLAIGSVLAVIAATSARTLLFGLKPGDPATLAIAIVALSVVAGAASLLPARRAAALDPMQALREE